MLAGEDYAETVEAFVGELMQVAASHGGMEIGVDLIAGREDGMAVLVVSPRAMAWAEQHYPPHAFRQCAPWLRLKPQGHFFCLAHHETPPSARQR